MISKEGVVTTINNYDVLNSNLPDINKLMMIFENDKDIIKANNTELYYALLAIKDDIKIGYKFIRI